MPVPEDDSDQMFRDIFLESSTEEVPQDSAESTVSKLLCPPDCDCLECEVWYSEDLETWLGSQAWKLDKKLNVTCIEIFPDHGRLRLTGERHDQILISIGTAHGQDLTQAGEIELAPSSSRAVTVTQRATRVSYPASTL